MAVAQFSCHVKNAHNFQENKIEKPIGHVTAFAFVKGSPIEPDHEVGDPMNPDSTVPVVGVIEDISWETEPTKPLIMTFLPTQASQGKIQSGYYGTKDGAEINIEFNIYKFDGKEQAWFETFTTDKKQVKCEFTRNVDPGFGDVAAAEVDSPKVYRTQLSLTGLSDAEQQMLILAFSKDEKIPKKFGGKKK